MASVFILIFNYLYTHYTRTLTYAYIILKKH